MALVQSDYHLPGDSAEIRALDAVVQRCLAKDPRDRYASAAELATDLAPALARCGEFWAGKHIRAADAKLTAPVITPAIGLAGGGETTGVPE